MRGDEILGSCWVPEKGAKKLFTFLQRELALRPHFVPAPPEPQRMEVHHTFERPTEPELIFCRYCGTKQHHSACRTHCGAPLS
jgi:hypothetical protein